MKSLNLYLVRHGQTEWNVKDQMQGSQNSPLTENGILGAKITGQYLKDTPFLRAYSSPQQRAVETRDYILAERNDHVPTFELAGLCEMDFGQWEGCHVPELKKTPEFNIYLTQPEHYDPSINGGETYINVLNRMLASLEQIVHETPEETGNILIVSHGTALRILIAHLKGIHWHHHRDDSYMPRILNTSISIVNYQQNQAQEDGSYVVEYYNDVAHIGDN